MKETCLLHIPHIPFYTASSVVVVAVFFTPLTGQSELLGLAAVASVGCGSSVWLLER